MTKNYKYPFQNAYHNYLNNIKHYSDQAIINAENSIDYFWRFYLGVQQNDPAIDKVTPTDIRAFLDYLENDRQYKIRTINKYLTYLRKYFSYLFEYQHLPILPTLSIADRHLNRSKTVVINLAKHLDDFIDNKELSLTTKKVIVLTALGVPSNKLIKLHFQDLSCFTNNLELLTWLKNNLKFEQNRNPLIFSKQNGQALTNTRMIRIALLKDQDHTFIPLSIQDLTDSYIYTLVANLHLSDQELLRQLNCSRKTLTYYKSNLNLYQINDYLKLKQKKMNQIKHSN